MHSPHRNEDIISEALYSYIRLHELKNGLGNHRALALHRWLDRWQSPQAGLSTSVWVLPEASKMGKILSYTKNKYNKCTLYSYSLSYSPPTLQSCDPSSLQADHHPWCQRFLPRSSSSDGMYPCNAVFHRLPEKWEELVLQKLIMEFYTDIQLQLHEHEIKKYRQNGRNSSLPTNFLLTCFNFQFPFQYPEAMTQYTKWTSVTHSVLLVNEFLH